MTKISKSIAILWPSIRISFALVLITISMILIADMLGVFPTQKQYELENRKLFSESLAVVFSTMANEKAIKNIRPVLSKIVLRQDDILSAGFRYNTGILLFSIGEHEQHWSEHGLGKSTATHVQVPIIKEGKSLGTVELSFASLNTQGFIGINKTLYKLILFVSLSGFFAFLFFILRTIRQIDPSTVVPDRVNSAFDTLSEGVVILDDKEQVVLVNSAFSEMVKRDSEQLVGLKLSELDWQSASSEIGDVLYPWLIAISSGESSIGDVLALNISSDVVRTLVINSAPIKDGDDQQQGFLLTFDDVTDLELQRQKLQSMVTDLETSKKEVQRKNKELHFFATRDPLTNCFNRRSFYDLFTVEFNNCVKEKEQLCCLMVDLDYFKKVNDNFGHAVGDDIIKMLADILQSSTRDRDIVGRYGGEEFCVVLPGLNISEATTVAERIRIKMKHESAKKYQAKGLRVTASIGISTLEDNAADSAALTDLADQALYVAKDTGRNRVVVWSKGSLSGMEVKKEIEPDLVTNDRIPMQAPSQYSEEVERLQTQIKQLEGAAQEFSSQLHLEQNFDKLTGISNHNHLYALTKKSVERSIRQGLKTAVLIVDLDLFSQVNNSFGRNAADEMFVSLVNRLIKSFNLANDITVNNSMTIARLNGDEIGVLLADINDEKEIEKVAKRILIALSKTLEHQQQQVNISCKIGISVYPEDADNSDELINHASIARSFPQKEQFLENFQFYCAGIKQKSLRQLALESEIRQAVDNGEWVLYYQPKMDIKTGEINSVEALIRWNHPEKGVLGPNEFIGLAEERGLIVEIGKWVLHTACQQVKRWSHMGIDISIAVNLSAIQIKQPNFFDTVMESITNAKIRPHQLELEVTESILMENVDLAVKVLNRLHSRGISISIDDFGTGYSSLSYLKQLPISALKIDRIFIKDILTDDYDKNIVNSVISMAHGMDLKVIAEGVETQEQLDLLEQLSCDEMQGFLLSRPVAADEVTGLLKKEMIA